MKNNILYIAGVFAIVFSGCFITILPVSPIYIAVIISFFLLIMYLLHNKTLCLFPGMVLYFLVFIYFTVFEIAFLKPLISPYMNMLISLSSFILTYFVISKITADDIYRLYRSFVYLSILLLIIEAVYRYANPSYFVDYVALGRPKLVFYYYKMNSIMYPDSNFVGLFVNTLFFSIQYFSTKFRFKNVGLIKLVLVILIVLTLSRASIITFAIFGIFASNIHNKNSSIKVYVFLGLLSILVYLAYSYILIDDSFASKFNIINRAIRFISNANMKQKLFGVGLGNTVSYLGIGSHNVLVTYLIETGFIGSLLVFVFWLYILKKTKFKAGIIMYPFVFNGFSLTTFAIPYLYVLFAMMISLETSKV